MAIKRDHFSFITGARSVDKRDLSKNLKFFKVPEASISSIYSKLAMRAFDVYASVTNDSSKQAFATESADHASANAFPMSCSPTSASSPAYAFTRSGEVALEGS